MCGIYSSDAPGRSQGTGPPAYPSDLDIGELFAQGQAYRATQKPHANNRRMLYSLSSHARAYHSQAGSKTYFGFRILDFGLFHERPQSEIQNPKSEIVAIAD